MACPLFVYYGNQPSMTKKRYNYTSQEDSDRKRHFRSGETNMGPHIDDTSSIGTAATQYIDDTSSMGAQRANTTSARPGLKHV